jgi:hypothetical protein
MAENLYRLALIKSFTEIINDAKKECHSHDYAEKAGRSA